MTVNLVTSCLFRLSHEFNVIVRNVFLNSIKLVVRFICDVSNILVFHCIALVVIIIPVVAIMMMMMVMTLSRFCFRRCCVLYCSCWHRGVARCVV